MCELCYPYEFEEIATLEVGRAAMMAQKINEFGAMHAVVSDCNMDDEIIISAIDDEEATEMDKVYGGDAAGIEL
jgi:hypothetical protein